MTHLPTDETSLPPETTVQAGELVPGAQNREHLVLEHLWQVSLIVRQMKARMPTWANADELQAAGILGLLAAIDQYSPDHSSTLRTFAEHKIRSAILDSLRALDWASRGQRKHLRLCERAKAKLEQRHQRPPTAEEMAAELGMTAAQYHNWQSLTQGLMPESLDRLAAQYEDDSRGRFLADSHERWPSYLAERAEMEHLLRQAIDTLPERERTVLHLYYYEELTLAEIAEVMNLGQSRICQLKARAVHRLRCCLRAENSQQNTTASADAVEREQSGAFITS